jgi:hypothetical protein
MCQAYEAEARMMFSDERRQRIARCKELIEAWKTREPTEAEKEELHRMQAEQLMAMDAGY